jgi:LPS sulfotransferase NodH
MVWPQGFTPAATPADTLTVVFPNLHHLWLRRRDKIKQGISYYRALETQVWRSTDRRAGDAREPVFNFAAIDRLVQLCIQEDHAWQTYFQQYQIQPLIITYEELAASPEKVVLSILKHLDLPIPDGLPPLRWKHQKQADQITEVWTEKYVAHAADTQSSPA